MKNIIGKHTYISKDANVTESVIGASSIVEGVVENSAIGKGCYIDKNSRIIHSTIGDYSQIYNSELTCVHTGTFFESEGAKIISARFGQKNTVNGELRNLLAGDNNVFKKTSVLEGERNVVGSNTIIDGRIVNSFIGDGTKIHHSGAVIENSCIVPYRRCVKYFEHGQTSLSMPPSEHGKEECFTVDIYNACITHSVVWGGSDISPGVNIRANSIIGPFVHVGTGGETKAAFIRGGSPINKVEAAHRNYLGNFLAHVIRINAPINSEAYYHELQEKMEALLYGTILARKTNQLVEDPIQPEEELIIDYKGKEISVTIEGINFGALFTTSNFDPRNDGIKGITIVKSGAKAGICSGAQSPVVIETKALLGSMSKTSGRQTSPGDIVVGGVPETIRRGAIISQRGRLGDRVKENIEINLDGLRQLDAIVNVSLVGQNKANEWEKLAYVKEIEILKAQIEELAGWTLRLFKLTNISVSNLGKDLESDALSPSAVALLQKRLTEQSEVLAQSDTIVKEIENIKNRAYECGMRIVDCGIIPHMPLRIHGTDGYRGNVHIEDRPVSYKEALEIALNENKILPELFNLMAYSTIQAFKLKGIDTENVLYGRDTRDLYTGIKGKEGRFIRAVIDGIRSTGSNVYDMGITPIPNAAYMLAYYDYERTPIKADVAFVKTASHNPKHQDGLKVFYRAGRGKYIKQMPDDEEIVTDIMFKIAIEGKEVRSSESGVRSSRRVGRYYNDEATAVQVFKQFMTNSIAKGSFLKLIDTVILDLSNGAVSAPPYKQVIDELLKGCGIKNRFYVGDKPDGININEDDPAKGKVGAGHFEGVDVINLEEIRDGEWGNFPVLEKLFECGMYKASLHPIPPPRGGRGRRGVGKLIVAILTDGDGDRGYTMIYNPWVNNVKLIDGDHALYLQLWSALENKAIANGETLAFTVESGVGFINGITSLIKKYGFNINLLETYDDEPSKAAINIVITPVGDKYILFKQYMGSESTGHIVKKGGVLAGDGRTKNYIFTGNGILGAIETLTSINDIGQKSKIHLVLNPYQHGSTQTTYCYFVDKQLWKRGNNVWKQAEAIIRDSLKKAFARKRGIVIEFRTFEREPHTLYMHVISEMRNLHFVLTLHVRSSGTEDKIGIKIFGENDKAITELLEEISEKMFTLFWQTMKNHSSKYANQEAEILRLLKDKESVTVARLKELFTSNAPNDETKRLAELELAFLIDTIKKQGLIKTEGTGGNTLLTLTERGETVI